MQITGRRYDTGETVDISIAAGRIADIAPCPNQSETLPWIAPGLFDIQINGYGGQEFSSLELTHEHVARIAREHYASGVTRMCPTLTTQSFEVLAHGMQAIAAACKTDAEIARLVAGIHLEGPYIAREDGPRGAHPLEHCKPPDWEEFQRLQEAADGRIVLVTISPEYEKAAEFIAKVTASGVVVAIGHTAATGAQIRAAADAGARLSTHLGNGAHRQLRRHPNYIWDQMAEDRLMASLIVDGHHLPPEVVKSMVRAKTPQRCILVSDESGLAGLPPGRYESSGGPLEILDDGRLVIAGQDQLLAGASLPIGTGIFNVMRYADVDLATAVDMASRHPAQLLAQRMARLEVGEPADLVQFELETTDGNGAPHGFEVVSTIVEGTVVYRKPVAHTR